MGFTWEVDVHLYLKRAWLLDTVFGTAEETRRHRRGDGRRHSLNPRTGRVATRTGDNRASSFTYNSCERPSRIDHGSAGSGGECGVVQPSGQGENRSRHIRGRSIATLSILVCIAAALAACGGGASTGARISLLPSTTAKSAAWKWTAACRVAPHGPTGCEPSGPEIGGHAQLAGNEWNLGPVPAAPAPAGSVSMALNTPAACS